MQAQTRNDKTPAHAVTGSRASTIPHGSEIGRFSLPRLKISSRNVGTSLYRAVLTCRTSGWSRNGTSR
jgi:hypothetical protein